MFKKLGFVSLVIAAVLVLGACNQTSSKSTPTTTSQPLASITSTKGPTSTSIPATPTIEFTATTAPTNTPEATSTPEATATPELIANLNTKLDASVNLEKLPVHQLEELTSGRLTYTEKQLGIKFSEKALPTYLQISDLKDQFVIVAFNPTDPNLSKYGDSPEYVPFKGVSANMFEINGKKVLVLGFAWLNQDRSQSILHVGIEGWKDQKKMEYWQKVFIGTHRLGFISKIYDPNFVHVIPVYGNYMADFRVDSDIVSQYADNNDRFDLLNKMVASGNTPDELQNLLLEPAIARWK